MEFLEDFSPNIEKTMEKIKQRFIEATLIIIDVKNNFTYKIYSI